MNPRMTESKSVALPLGYSPINKMGWDIRVELMTSSATNWRPNQLGQSHHSCDKKVMARCGGLEPPAYCLEGSCSIQLS